MSERRPPWDDSLVESVIHAISDYFDYEYRAYAVIAAVEDWHRDRWTGVCESPEEVVRELNQAQAAIRRVREIHRIVSPHWRPKTLREKLCQQEWSAPDDETREAIVRLIATLDRHRPLGSDGKHGDLHTATCGCELDGVMRCQHCGHDYPCPTIRALDGDGDE